MNLGVNRFSAVMTLTMAAALCGCSGTDYDSVNQPWFRKPLELFGQKGGYTFSDVQEVRRDRPITANDLIEANGSCPPPAAPAPGPSGQAAGPAAPPMPAGAGSVMGEVVSLGMSECEVVYRAGQPSNLQFGKNPYGERTAVLTYQSGPRPGVYRFEGGHLMEMDRVEEPAPPAQAAKKKPAKTKQTAKSNAAT